MHETPALDRNGARRGRFVHDRRVRDEAAAGGAGGADGGALFFESPDAWRGWLAEHHATASELLVGFHKVGTGRPTISWPESVAEALCFGWIDGIRRSLGADAYTIRFTPRRPRSHWSRVNVDLVARLEAEGRMADAGRTAFAARREDRTAQMSFEATEPAVLDPQQEALFRADAAAWAWFEGQRPYYRRTALHWVTSAKRADTRERRLATLIECSGDGLRIPPLRPYG
jgi:uncharacterized protein YdeI (YjbR/CyaY-like superfamily)